jgi:hypothetical protein
VQPAEIFIRNLPRNNYLLGSALRPALVNAMDGLQLNFVVTDSLNFYFNTKVSRRVPLKLDPKQQITGNRYVVTGPVKITPDSVTFTGPSSMVDSIPSPFLLRLPAQKLTAPATIEVPIAYGDKTLVQSNIEQAEVAVEVKGLVQEERLVTPQLINAPPKRLITLTPASVLIRYQLLADSAAAVRQDTFKVVLDYSKYNLADSTLVPELVKMPANLRKVTLQPGRVKVVVQQQK